MFESPNWLHVGIAAVVTLAAVAIALYKLKYQINFRWGNPPVEQRTLKERLAELDAEKQAKELTYSPKKIWGTLIE